MTTEPKSKTDEAVAGLIWTIVVLVLIASPAALWAFWGWAV